MKPILVLVVTVLLLAVACKRQEIDPIWRGTITAEIDSVAVTFDLNVKAEQYYSSISKNHNVRLVAYQKETGNGIDMYMVDTTTVAPGGYCEDGSTGSRRLRLFWDGKGDKFYHANSNSAANPAKATLIVLTEKNIQGTFSGDVYLLEYRPPNLIATNVKKRILNGRFDLRLE